MVGCIAAHGHCVVLVTSSDIHIAMYMIFRHDVGHNRTTEAAWVSRNRRYCCTSNSELETSQLVDKNWLIEIFGYKCKDNMDYFKRCAIMEINGSRTRGYLSKTCWVCGLFYRKCTCYKQKKKNRVHQESTHLNHKMLCVLMCGSS